jgi:hypothetical protein
MSLLSRVQGDQDNSARAQDSNGNDVSLVSELHNPSFFASPPADNSMDALLSHSESRIQKFRVFLNGFFRSIHYIHPILDKSAFLLPGWLLINVLHKQTCAHNPTYFPTLRTNYATIELIC